MEMSVYSNALEKDIKKIKIYVIVLALLAAALCWYALKNTFLRVPADVTSAGTDENIKSGDYVKITSDKYYYMGLIDAKGKKAEGYYYLVVTDKALFIVRSKKDLRENNSGQAPAAAEFRGIARSDRRRQANMEILAEMGVPRELADDKLSEYIISDKDANGKIWMFFLLIPLLAFAVTKALGIGNNKKNRDRLEKFMNLMAAEQSFDAEFNARDDYLRIGNLHMTRSWLFNDASGEIFLMPVSEAVWAYVTVTQHRTNGIPAGKTYAATVCFSDGERNEIKGKSENCGLIIEGIAARNKRTIIGFNEELSGAWARDTKAFIEQWKAGKTDG